MKWYTVLLYFYFVGIRAQGSRVAEKRAGVTENAVWRYWTVGLQNILFSCSFWLIENIKSYFLQVFEVRAHQVKSCSNPLWQQITLACVQVAWWVTRTCCSDTSKRQITLFERKARAVRTDNSFYQTDSLSYSNRWHCFFKLITRSVWTDNNFFRTDHQSCSNQGLIKYQIFAEISLSQLSVILCDTKFTGFVFVAHNTPRFAMGL